MPLYRTPLVSSAQPVVFLAGPNAGCVTPYFQQQLLNISAGADAGAASDPDIAALTATVAGKVAKSTFTTWASPTGTAERTAFATYTAPVISAAYTQAEVQAIANHVQILSRRLKALVDDLKS